MLRCATSLVSIPAACSRTTSVILMPGMYSSVRTRGDEYSLRHR